MKTFNKIFFLLTRIWRLIAAFAIFLVAVVLFSLSTYDRYADSIISKERIINNNNTGVILFDRQGRQFFKFYNAKLPTYVPLSKISIYLQKAIISSEDKHFYSHPGFSWEAVLAAILADIQNGDLRYGGSTITQQLVKNSLLTSKRSILRKYQEILLAYEMEKRYSKNEILEMYLNSVYFGEDAYGAQDAAKKYFGKKASDLTLAESSLLAGLLPAPTELSPISGNKQKAISRQKYVLQEMHEEGYINELEKLRVENEELAFQNVPIYTSQAPHFAMMVKQELIQKYGERFVAMSGFKIYTSLDLDWQKYAETVLKEQVGRLAWNNVTNGAVVVMDPKTGEVRALVGSKDWDNEEFGKVNVAIMPRQPGSTFKPVIYLSGFEQGKITTSTVLMDKPITLADNYKPENYDRRYRGAVTVRRALANSLNIPSIEVIMRVGLADTLEMAKRLGITNLKDTSYYGPSLVLGTGEVSLLELTNAYSTIANQGDKHEITTITKIVNKLNNTEYSYIPRSDAVVNSQYTFLISSILSDANARREVFGSELNISRPAAVKTGTTENYKDAWTIGYTPSLAIGVWIGNNDGRSMDNIAGSLGAAPIWRNLMESFMKGTLVETFEPPPGVIARTLCGSQNTRSVEYFVSGSEPARSCMFGDGDYSFKDKLKYILGDKDQEKEELQIENLDVEDLESNNASGEALLE